MAELWTVVGEAISQLTSRSAIAGGAAAVAVAAVLAWWLIRVRQVSRERQSAVVAIMISGSRGKSSTVRLVHAALTEAGYRAYGKTTGTAAAELPVSGSEHPTTRFGQVSVVEMCESIHRAMNDEPTADALVLECMAVRPALINLVSQRMVRPDIVVITNVLLDHLEEEGGSLEQIAASLGEAITPGCLVVTGEQRPGPLSVLANIARHRGANLVEAQASDIPESIRTRLVGSHPQNIALTLAITRALNIPDDVAIAGMARTSREPGAREIWHRDLGELQMTYVDLGAINDPESLLGALHDSQLIPPNGGLRIGVLIGRWDRPLRAMEFAGLMTPGSFDALVVTGGPVHAIRSVLMDNGWSSERIEIAVHLTGSLWMWRRRLARLVHRVDPKAQGQRAITLISLENIHDGGADRLREYCRQGDLVSAP